MSKSEQDIPIEFEADISARTKFILNLRYGPGALLQTSPEISKHVALTAERESSLDNLVIAYDIGNFVADFDSHHNQIVIADITADYESLRFTSFSIDFLRKMVSVCQKKEGGLIAYKHAILNRKIDMLEKRQLDKEGNGLEYLSNLTQEIQALKKSIADWYGVKSLKLVLTGIDVVPSSEQPELFNIAREIQIPGSFPQPVFLSENLPTTHGVRSDGIQIGVLSNRLTIQGYNQTINESIIEYDRPQLTR